MWYIYNIINNQNRIIIFSITNTFITFTSSIPNSTVKAGVGLFYTSPIPNPTVAACVVIFYSKPTPNSTAKTGAIIFHESTTPNPTFRASAIMYTPPPNEKYLNNIRNDKYKCGGDFKCFVEYIIDTPPPIDIFKCGGVKDFRDLLIRKF